MVNKVGMQPLNIVTPQGTKQPMAAAKAEGTDFASVIKKAVDGVSAQGNEANKLVEGLASGEHANIHETMIAVEKAGISFRLMTKVSQKVIDAYREVMRMQI